MKQVIVLSGGSIRGAWQTGALRGALEHMDPDSEITALFGISVGALNAAYITSHTKLDESGVVTVRQLLAAAHEMESFWVRRVTGPRSLVRIRNAVEIAQSVFNTSAAFSGWRGLVDYVPLSQIYDDESDFEIIRRTPYPIEVGFTDYSTGDYSTHDLRAADSAEMAKKMVFASAVTPITMDYVQMSYGDENVARMTDGGLRHIVPSEEVVAMCDAMLASGEPPDQIGVTVVACHPKIVPNWIVGSRDALREAKWRPGLAHVVERAFRLMEHAVVDAGLYFLKTELGSRGVVLNVIRSEDEYLTNSIIDFTTFDVQNMIHRGYQSAHDCWIGQPEAVS